MVIIYCLISLICLALAYILIFTSYVDQFRVHQFIKRWNTLIQEGARELQELESRDTYIYESAIQSFKDKYYPVANAAIGFRRPKSPQLISQILDYLTFANKYRTIDSIAINVNSQYFNLSSEELSTDFNKIKTDNRYVGYHEYEEFKEKWSKILYEFNDIKDHSSYSKTIQHYNIFCTVHNIFVNNDFDTTRINNNKLYSKNELINNSNFFDTLFAYPLDKQQREAIVSAEDNTLVVSSAGSGKTSTIVGKVRYLVEQKGVDPNSILVVTYTRKAALELRERMGISGVCASTFHKHALDTIGLLTGSKPTIADSATMRQIFENTIRNDKAFITHINKYITDLINLSKEDHQYESSKQRAADIQKYGLKVPYNDMDGKSIYVRSKQEYQIAIILTHLGISFRYEEKYPYDTSSISKRQYRPDFVIYYDKVFYDSNGKACIQKAQLYYEHFGIDSHGNVPKWFGEGLEGGWIKAQQDYIAGIHWKRNIHKTLKTTLMETTSADFSNRTENEMESFIESKLRACGVPIKRLSEEDKRKKLLEANSRVDETLYTLINGFITLLKANQRSINELIQNISNKDKHKERNTYILENIIRPIYEKYQATLKSDGIYDYTDILLNAAELCEKQNPFSYEYILVDEFQDISMDKYIYLKSLRKREPYTKLFCVGDDWQSIYRFSGSDMTLFYDFKKFFGYTNECYIETTHRFGEPLLSASSIFILTNPEQKKKEVKTTSELNTTINFIPYSGLGTRKDLETIIRQIPSNDSIYILGRYKFNATQIGGRETQYGQTINIAGRDIQYLTIHSSKGLEADHVIILDCDNGTYGFPSLIADDPILEYVLSGTDSFDNSEERRVFYVAVTRARKATYCLFSRETPSPFLSEFGEYCRYSDSTEAVCPRCGRGYVKILKSGKTQRGDAYITVGCSNSGCDYFENLFKDDIFRYQPRSLINRTPLSEYLMKNNLENRYMNFNTRLWWLKENNTGEIFPIVISPNLVASSHLLERIKHSTDDYDICEVKYYDDTICFLTKRTGNIFISNQDLSNYLNLIAGANNTQKYY